MAEPHQSRVYSDLARFYDFFFGRVFVDREHEVIEGLNLRPGNRVLEVGVGTGIALGGYPPYAHVVAIDPSADMLKKARMAGYRPETKNGTTMYCQETANIGTRFPKAKSTPTKSAPT